MYKGVYEMMASEKPTDAIIENDARFDQWIMDYTRKLARQGKAENDRRHKQSGNFNG